MSEPSYKLTYALTTFNRLPYFREVLLRLLAHAQPDEEIVVCDGGSTDGTQEFLQELFEAGRIQQFTSGADRGESHGFNKALWLARGELIKLISDDDAFDYATIRRCRDWLLANPEVVVLYANTGMMCLEDGSQVEVYDDAARNFEHWCRTGEPVWLIGLTCLLRRSALPLTGLFKTGVIQADSEFALRITSLGLPLAWCSALGAIRIENELSGFRILKNQGLSEDESERMRFFYNKNIKHNLVYYLRHRAGLVEALKQPLRRGRQWLGYVRPAEKHTFATGQPALIAGGFGQALDICEAAFNQYNGQAEITFKKSK